MSKPTSEVAITVKDLSATLADLQPTASEEVATLLDVRRRELSAVAWATVWATTEMAHLVTHTIGQTTRLVDGARALPAPPLGTNVVEHVIDRGVSALQAVNSRACAHLTQRTLSGRHSELPACQADLRMLRIAADDTMVHVVNVALRTLDSISQIPPTPTDGRQAAALSEIVSASLAAMEEVVTLAITKFEGLSARPPKRSFFSRLFSGSPSDLEQFPIDAEQFVSTA